jgi:excisionase family DNA binding protein
VLDGIVRERAERREREGSGLVENRRFFGSLSFSGSWHTSSEGSSVTVTSEEGRTMNGKGVRSRRPEGRGATAEKELVDINWVAKRLGVAVRHVRRLVAEQRIPFIKWGHLLRFDPDEIENWIDDARRPRRP